MKRSLIATLALVVTTWGGSVARADLDSLLGDWTDAATQEAGSTEDSKFSLAPASEGIAETDSDSPLEPNTLTGAHPHSGEVQATGQPPIFSPIPSPSPAAVESNPASYGSPSPTVNPYCASGPSTSDCPCGSGACDSSCGCGRLVPRQQIGHLVGESECRPHRRPVLPPPGNLLQMFRSKNSYSAVWAGYADETRARLRNISPHLNGTWNTCDDGGLIEPGCTTCGPGCAH